MIIPAKKTEVSMGHNTWPVSSCLLPLLFAFLVIC